MYSYHNTLKKLLRTEEYVCIKAEEPFIYRFVFPKLGKSYPIREYMVEEYKKYIDSNSKNS